MYIFITYKLPLSIHFNGIFTIDIYDYYIDLLRHLIVPIFMRPISNKGDMAVFHVNLAGLQALP